MTEDAPDERAEESRQNIEAEKMAMLGHLVAGIAHEINTPLGALKSNAQTTKSALEELEAADEGRRRQIVSVLQSSNAITREAISRIEKLVTGLRIYARGDKPQPQATDLQQGIESTISLVEHLTRDRIDVLRDLDPLPAVTCHPSQINQVFLNLLVNGIQSIDGEGQVTVRTRKDGDEVTIAFEDTGCGISKENLEKITKPGFTTKKPGEGTGLGLSVVREILDSHGGRLMVESEVGRGSTFTVHLPVQPR